MVTVAATLIGPYPLTPGEILRALAHRLVGAGSDLDSAVDTVLFGVRLPRIAAALLVGAALAGAAYQLDFGHLRVETLCRSVT
jgi:iron complex transport system permease protein